MTRHRLALAAPGVSLGGGPLVQAGLLVLLTFAPFLRRDRGVRVEDPEKLGVPWRPILLVGVALVLFYMVDTAATAWGPVYLSSDKVFDHPPTSPAMFALATLPYLAATLLARSVGDQLTARVGGTVMMRPHLTWPAGARTVQT